MKDDTVELNGFWVDEYFIHIPQDSQILEETEDSLSIRVMVYNNKAEPVDPTPELNDKIVAALSKILDAAIDEMDKENNS